MSNHGLNHGARYDVREKRSKEKIATDALRLQRREQRDIEEGRAVIGELEKRVVEAQKEKEQGKSTVGVGSEQVKKLTLELAEERRKVARLQVDLLSKRTQRDKEAARLIDVQEAPGRLRKSLESSHSSLGALLSSIEQRQTVLQQLIEGQKEALISLGMSEHAKRLTSDEGSLPLQAFQSSLDALLSKLSLAWSSNGGGGPKLSLSPSLLDDLGNLFPSNDDSPSSALSVTREAFGLAIPASAQLSTSGHDDSTTDTKRYLATETGCQHDGGTDMLARAQEQLIEEQRRVATAQACLLAVKQGKSSPLSSRASQPRRQGQDLISLLHKTSKDLNKTIKQLRDEQSELMKRFTMA
ncbi:hypothetical protein BCR35DRAFT_305804 [Leucosporidium creatinivorum]|uniref:Uncharacterized protein n=1 Tax=Leucosporidium creatinivorum TaxID=106004 RepID=A0A1Y2EY79_9BASI|nr:hypothetical protein BCR35DRAFT_305804 [Leucosporidium creatinivorum]